MKIILAGILILVAAIFAALIKGVRSIFKLLAENTMLIEDMKHEAETLNKDVWAITGSNKLFRGRVIELRRLVYGGIGYSYTLMRVSRLKGIEHFTTNKIYREKKDAVADLKARKKC